MFKLLIALPRYFKQVSLATFDCALSLAAFYLGYLVRLDGDFPALDALLPPLTFTAFLTVLSLWVTGVYRLSVRYFDTRSIFRLMFAFIPYGASYFAFLIIWQPSNVPRSIGLIQPILLISMAMIYRVMLSYILRSPRRLIDISSTLQKRVILLGAGPRARALVDDVLLGNLYVIVAMTSDNESLKGSYYRKIPVIGVSSFPSKMEGACFDEVWFIRDEFSQPKGMEILNSLGSRGIHARTLPSFSDLLESKVNVSAIRELDVDELLGREPVSIDENVLQREIIGRVVLITGAGGSIGSELARQLYKFCPSKLILLEISEYSLYKIYTELTRLQRKDDASKRELGGARSDIEVIPVLASTTSSFEIDRIFSLYRPRFVYHAAAYKHVDLVQQNARLGLYNNIWSTYVCASTSIKYGVHKFILVSSDKAVRPANYMGLSKRISEIVILALSRRVAATNCSLSFVRFGNVLGSSGSVVPLFREQIHSGGPVTVTDPEVSRYFMTIREAVGLVLVSSTFRGSGNAFVLDMGEPVRIVELAKRMIELSGKQPTFDDVDTGLTGEHVRIIFTGLGSGEKIKEELLINGELSATSHPKIRLASEDFDVSDSIIERIETIFSKDYSQEDDNVLTAVESLLPPGEDATGLSD